MSSRQEEFQQRLLATFRVEAEELVQAVASGLIDLEKLPDRPEETGPVLERTFRAAHSLKGAARAVDMFPLEEVCQAMESLLRDLKKGNLAASRELFDFLHEAVGAVSGFLEGQPGAEARLRSTTQRLSGASLSLAPPAVPRTPPARPPEPPPPNSAVSGTSPPAAPGTEQTPPLPAGAPLPPPAPAPPETGESARPAARGEPEKTVRVPSTRMDRLLEQAEEMLYIKSASQEKARLLSSLAEDFEALRKQWRERLPGLRSLCRGNAEEPSALGDFLDWHDETLRQTGQALRDFLRGFSQDRHAAGRQIDDHLECLRETVMLPFSSLTAPLPKMLRDLARACRKEVELTVEGESTEVDKRILDDLRDPLTHLLRNSVDHGIEPPERRGKEGKPPAGRILVSLERKDSRRAVLTVADDGAGIDPERVREKAAALQLASEAECAAMKESELLGLIFRSEFSTSRLITTLSGRGLGLAIVREAAERLGGSVAVENRPGRGATFRLNVPLSLSTLRGLVLTAAGRRLILPTRNLVRLVRRQPEEIRTLENREAIQVDGQWISWVELGEVLGLPSPPGGPETKHLLAGLLQSGETRVAFGIDDVQGEEEILLKPLGKLLRRVRHIAGAAVMGSGAVVPVLDPDDLVRSALQISRGRRPVPAGEETAGRSAPAVLVADDSITSRVLLKNVLEAAGYRVTTAIDGQDAWFALKGAHFDGVVTDVEMPRLNGFELTARIRRDPGLERLPVVLVTALESPEDRERGIDAGASAYIVKSNFDQSNLLDVLRRLL